jgi:hypothetical protein
MYIYKTHERSDRFVVEHLVGSHAVPELAVGIDDRVLVVLGRNLSHVSPRCAIAVAVFFPAVAEKLGGERASRLADYLGDELVALA